MTNLAQNIKTQIVVQLQALKTAGDINSIAMLDNNANPFKVEASNGYPLAIVAMPKITGDYEDQANDLMVYDFSVMFIVSPEEMADQSTGVEVLIDHVLAQFNQLSSLTLGGAAQAGVLTVGLEGGPVATGDKTYLVFVATLRARTLFQTQ
jgi:hypothetical protein